MTDAEMAAHLAEQAGRILLNVREAGVFQGKDLGIAGDQVADRFLVKAVGALRPDDGILCEETRDTAERLEKSRVWIIDPVDGSREYGECRSDWAVHVGLAIDGVASVGAVALPDLGGGTVLRSDADRHVAPRDGKPRIVVSRTRPPAEASYVADRIGGEIVPMGSAGAKAMAVVRGEAEIYLHSGGQYEWDSCAPVAVAKSHGLHCSRLDGSELLYNRSDPYLPDMLICRSELSGRVLEALQSFGGAG